MQTPKKIDWKNILSRVVNELPISQEITENDLIFRFQYICIDEITHVGYLYIWEKVSLKAIHISRIRVPQGMEEIRQNIPEILDMVSWYS